MKKIIFSLVIACGLFAVAPIQAADPLLNSAILNEANCGSTGQPACTLNTFVKLGINVTKIILGIVGSLTLAMFIYGGIMLLISGGNTERVAKGKEIIFGSVVGLLIVFGSYTIINFVVNNVFQAKINVDNKTQNAFTGSAPGSTGATGPGSGCTRAGGTCIASSATCSGQTPSSDCGANKKCCVPPVTNVATCTSRGYTCQAGACSAGFVAVNPQLPCLVTTDSCCQPDTGIQNNNE